MGVVVQRAVGYPRGPNGEGSKISNPQEAVSL